MAAVLQLIQPLRGLASLADYPPLPDVLDAIERCLGEARRLPPPAGNLAAALRAAALAIARASREIAGGGRADPEAEELGTFIGALAALLDLDPSVVPIETLFADGGGPHIVEAGVPPAGASPPSGAELVAHGEHLTLAAHEIERASSAAERDLRAQALLGTFRTLAAGGDGPLAKAAATFGRAGREALAHRWASTRGQEFVTLLRRAGDALSAAGRLEEPRLASLLDTVTSALREPLGGRPAAAAGPARPPLPGGSGAVAPAALRAPSAAEATHPARTTVPPAAAPAPAGSPAPAAPDVLGLAGSYQRFERLAAALGAGNPSVDTLLSGPPLITPSGRGVARPSAPAPSTPAPRAIAGGDGLIPIGDLVYSGPAALDRALALREDVRRALTSSAPDADAVRELIEEIFDLVALGQGRGR
jgi:hypothetical protein